MDVNPKINNMFTVLLFISVETLLADPPNVAATVCDTELNVGDIAIDDVAILNGSVDRFVFDMLRIGGGGGLLQRPCDRFSGGAVRGACCVCVWPRVQDSEKEKKPFSDI